MRRVALLAFVMCLGWALPSAAQTVDRVLSDAGVLGTWATDCALPPQQGGNTHSIYARLPNGTATLTYDNGPNVQATVYTILSAELRGAGRVFYLQQNQRDGRQLEIELLRVGERIQVQLSRRTTGEVLVANGKFTSDGASSPWQTRCR